MRRLTGSTSAGLAVVCVAQFVVVLDVTIVTTALPVIRTGLGFSSLGLAWVITAYVVVFGGLLVAGGRVADLLGPRRAFGLGLAWFVLASVACALAWSPAALVGARALQGIGAALLSPAGLALLPAVSGSGPARRRAVGWWTAAAAGGGAGGWVLGGLFAEYLGWRAVFWVNLPIGVVALLVARTVLPDPDPDPGRGRRGAGPDLTGAVVATVAVGAAVYALTGIGANGPLEVLSWLPLLVAGGLVVFLVRHLRQVRDPLVPPALLRSRAVAGASLTALALTASTSSAMYLAVLYVQQVLRLSPARASLLFPALNVTVIAGSLAGPALLRYAGSRRTAVAGFAAIAAGCLLLTTLPDGGMPIGRLLGAFALMGTGLGAASVASTHAGTEAADPAYGGVAAGVLSSAAQVGTALGLAIVAPLAVGAHGFRAGFIGATVLTLAGLAAAFLIPPAPARSPNAAGRVRT